MRGAARWWVSFVVTAAAGCQGPSSGSDVERRGAAAITAERDLDDPVPRPQGIEDRVIDAAGDGSSFLLIWGENDSELWAARFGLDGERLEPFAHLLGSTRGGAQVAFAGSGYVLAWTDAGSVYASRMTGDGALAGVPVEVARLVAADGDQRLTRPDLAIAGDRVFVVWSVDRGTAVGVVRARLFDLSLAPVGAAFDVYPVEAALVSATSDGSDFFAAWRSTGGGMLGTRVTSAGEVVDGSGLAIGSGSAPLTGPSLAYGGGQYLAVWRAGVYPRVFGRRFTPSGISVDATPIEFTAGANDGFMDPGAQASFDGSRFAISWIDDRDGGPTAYATWLATDGTLDPVGGKRIDDREAQLTTASASTGGETILVSGTRFDGTVFALVDTAGATITSEPQQAAWHANAEVGPALCATSSGHLAAWRDDRSERGIYAAPLNADGSLAGPAGRIAPGFAEPAIACGDAVHLAAWRDQYSDRVYAVRVDDDGAPLDDAPIDLGGVAVRQPVVASSGGGFLVIWSTGSNVYGRRVDAGGGLPDPGAIPVSTAAGAQDQAGLAYGGGVYLAAWLDTRSGTASLYGARIDPDGTVLDLTGVPLGASFDGDQPAFVAYGSPGFLVGWQSAPSRLRGRLVNAAGTPAGPERVIMTAPSPAEWTRTVATWDGSSFAVVGAVDDQPTAIVMTRVGADGVSVALGGEMIASGAQELVRWPAVSASASDGVLVAFERSAVVADRVTPRVRLRGVTVDAPGAACATAVSCASGHCVDGVCCDEACGGGDPADCQACSVAGGAAVDGTCAPIAAATVCRPAAGACDVAESCDGAEPACPADQQAADGTGCSDGDACTTDDACLSGACVPAASVDCTSDDPCQAGLCEPSSGECAFTTLEDGTPCPPPDLCVLSAACVAGACQAGPAVDCPEPPACQQSEGCNPATGECATSPVADGTPCADGMCRAGACVPLAGSPDAGPPDAGVPDAGVGYDAGAPADDGSSSGCGCRAASTGQNAAATALFIVLALLGRAYARRRPGGRAASAAASRLRGRR